MPVQTKTKEQLEHEIKMLRKENEALIAKLKFREEKVFNAPHSDKSFIKDKSSVIIDTKAKISRLTKREKQVLELILKSHTSKEIASILNISKLTVDTHRKHILKKLGVSTLVDLLKLVMKQDGI